MLFCCHKTIKLLCVELDFGCKSKAIALSNQDLLRLGYSISNNSNPKNYYIVVINDKKNYHNVSEKHFTIKGKINLKPYLLDYFIQGTSDNKKIIPIKINDRKILI